MFSLVRDPNSNPGDLNRDVPLPDAGLRTAALFCAVAVLWLATRPFFGTVFDARFYMVEAIRALHPDRFAQDLYFQFGSQGNFSLFTKLYLPLLPLLGVGATALILTVAGQLLWLFGLFRLARSLVAGRLLWLSVAVVIGMLQAYPGGFSYGENYPTARLYAEALVMLGLAWMPARPFPAMALLALSAAMHPLMALPALALVFVYLALARPIWWAVMAGGAGLAALLALSGVAPFAGALRTIDPQWLAIIKIRSPQCFLGEWPAQNFQQVLGVVAWAAAALVFARKEQRRFLAAALLVGLGGLACTYLGADLAHNVLAVQLQPWRAMWLLQLVSRICVPLVLLGALSRTSLDGYRWATFLAAGLILAASATRLARQSNAADFTFFSMALVCGALAVMAAQLLLTEPRHGRIVLACALAGVALVPIALSRWDMRSPWLNYVASPQPPPKELAALLPEGSSVYWESGLEMLWLRLQRGSYYSCDQGTGALFQRQTAMAYQSRAASLSPLRSSDPDPLGTCAVLDPQPQPQRNRLGLRNACIREPGLDYMVLTAPLDGVEPKGIWKSPVYFQDFQSSASKVRAPASNRFYVYSCAVARA